MDQFYLEQLGVDGSVPYGLVTFFLFQGHFNCIEELRERDLKWKYFINLCGDDFPIKTSSGWVSKMFRQSDPRLNSAILLVSF